jgi:hypothetical protein
MPRSLLRSLPLATKPAFTSTTTYQHSVSRLEGPDGVYSPATLVFSVTFPRRHRYTFPFMPPITRRDINLSPIKNREFISGKFFNRKGSRRHHHRLLSHHGHIIVHLFLHIACLGSPVGKLLVKLMAQATNLWTTSSSLTSPPDSTFKLRLHL